MSKKYKEKKRCLPIISHFGSCHLFSISQTEIQPNTRPDGDDEDRRPTKQPRLGEAEDSKEEKPNPEPDTDPNHRIQLNNHRLLRQKMNLLVPKNLYLDIAIVPPKISRGSILMIKFLKV
ncbi:unnamed protein product [Malus baccata var. baccata]